MSDDNDKEFEKRRILALEKEKQDKNKADTDKDASSKRKGGTGTLTSPNNTRSTFNDIINDILYRLVNKVITDKDIYFNINDIQCTLTNVNLTYVNWKLNFDNGGYILIDFILDVPIIERYIEIDITNFNNNKLFINYFEINVDTIKTIELKPTSPISEIASRMDNKPGTNKSVLEIPINNFRDILNIQMEYNEQIPTYKQVNLIIKKPKYIDIGKFYGYNNLYTPPKKELQEEQNKIFLRYILSNIKYFNKFSYIENTTLGLIDISTLISQSNRLVKEEIKQELVLPESLIQENFGNLNKLTDFYDFEKNGSKKNDSKKNIEIMFFAIIVLIILLLVLYNKLC